MIVFKKPMTLADAETELSSAIADNRVIIQNFKARFEVRPLDAISLMGNLFEAIAIVEVYGDALVALVNEARPLRTEAERAAWLLARHKHALELGMAPVSYNDAAPALMVKAGLKQANLLLAELLGCVVREEPKVGV